MSKLIININDISPYKGNMEYTAETIKIDDFDIIKNVRLLVEKFADWSLSPQSLFESEGIDYLSYFIVFEDIDGVRRESEEMKKEVICTLQEILKRESFSVDYADIIELEISFPEKEERIAPVF